MTLHSSITSNGNNVKNPKTIEQIMVFAIHYSLQYYWNTNTFSNNRIELELISANDKEPLQINYFPFAANNNDDTINNVDIQC